MDTKEYDYDLIVIGGGSGGMAAAKEAKRIKPELRVAIFDFVKPSPLGTRWGFGGTCVNVGCIPKKLMHHACLLGHSIDSARVMGWDIPDDRRLNWESMAKVVQDYVGSLSWSYQRQLHEAGVKLLRCHAKLVDRNTVEFVERGRARRLTARHLVIATGGRPDYGDCPGRELCLSSDDLFWLKQSPGSVLVVGAGYVALECASFLQGMGTGTITVMVRSTVLRKFDDQCASQVAELMERRGIRFVHGTPISFRKRFPQDKQEDEEHKQQAKQGGESKKQEKHDLDTESHGRGKIEVSYISKGEKTIRRMVCDSVILATGRLANVRDIGLQEAGIRINMNKILVDEWDRTSVDNVFAIGDVATGIKEHSSEVGTPVYLDMRRIQQRDKHDPSDERHPSQPIQQQSSPGGKPLESSGARRGRGRSEEETTRYAPGAIVAVSRVDDEDRKVFTVRLDASATDFRVEEKDLVYRSKDRPELTPVAIKAGMYLARRLFAPGSEGHDLTHNHKVDYAWVPTCVFSLPEYACVGLTTREAQRDEKAGGVGKENVEVRLSRYAPLEQLPFDAPNSHPASQATCLFNGKNLWTHRQLGARAFAPGDQVCYRGEADRHAKTPATIAAIHVGGVGTPRYDIALHEPHEIALNEPHDTALHEPQDGTPMDGPGTDDVDVAPSGGQDDFSVRKEDKRRQEDQRDTTSKTTRSKCVVDGEGRKVMTMVPQDDLDLRDDSAAHHCARYAKSDHLAKVIIDKRSGKILGLHFVGANAGEIVQGFALACSLGATKADLEAMVGIHPTAAEEFAVLDKGLDHDFLKHEGCGGGSC